MIDAPALAEEPQPTLQQLRNQGIAKSALKNPASVAKVDSIKPDLATFRETIWPILFDACVDCHGPDATEGNIRIDTLDPNLFHGDDVDWWLEVLAVVTKGEMPPPDDGELNDKNRERIIQWLSSQLHGASIARRAQGDHSSFRRLTRNEYNYALQDLLGLPYNFASDLPPDAISEDGFLNSSETLHMSSMQFATYRQLALTALRKATVTGEQPKPIYWGIPMSGAAKDSWKRQDKQKSELQKKHKDNPGELSKALAGHEKKIHQRQSRAHYKNLQTGRTGVAEWNYRKAQYAWQPASEKPAVPNVSNEIAVIPRRQSLIVELGDQIPEQGTLRVRFRASQSGFPDPRAANLQLEFGWKASNDSRASVRISQRDINITATSERPEFYQWDIPLSEIQPRNTMRGRWKMGDLPNPSEFLTFVNCSDSDGNIQIDYVEVTGGVFDEWPPLSHTKLFFDHASQADEKQYAKVILQQFMARAWRRSIEPDELQQKLAMFKKLRPQMEDFNNTMIEVLATILASPNFLYINYYQSPDDSDRLSSSELATRLSMFLWSSIPDAQLTAAANEDRLTGEALRGHIKRMLSDQKAQRFTKHFVRQWLGMQLLDYLQSDKTVHPHFDDLLKESMQGEPIALFQHVLDNDLSVLDFVHTDYGIVNQRLARHYGLPNVYGTDFQRVTFSPEHQRGGLLTQAGLLAMNSDGKDSHPLKRGVWLLERILNDPPPPPPADVPEIDLADPKIAQMTLKQRIEDHRNHAACMSCHIKIDPWGIAFENFDALGGWRSEANGKPVEATSTLSNKQKINGVDGLKRYLLANRQDQFVGAVVHKMATYALGRPLTFADHSSVQQIAADLRQHGDGLATLVELIVMSDLFQKR